MPSSTKKKEYKEYHIGVCTVRDFGEPSHHAEVMIGDEPIIINWDITDAHSKAVRVDRAIRKRQEQLDA